MMADRPVILATCDYYLPGFKAGGPVRTLAGIGERLGDDFRFRMITRDRDLGDDEPYPRVPVGSWIHVGPWEVVYLPPRCLTLLALHRLIRATAHDIFYVNSVCSVPFFVRPMLLRRLGLIPRHPLIIAPRGELNPDALALQRLTKRIYLALVRAMGLTRGATWQASSAHEADSIRSCFGQNVCVTVAPDLPPTTSPIAGSARQKETGRLRLLFISRISRMKNLDGALNVLMATTGQIDFTIYGPLEDAPYWAECQGLVANLPTNVTVRYGGVLPPERVPEAMADHDLLILPTLGENFGHVILEALASGCPVLISDRTTWRGLAEAGVGWDISLEQPESFQEVLHNCLMMDSAAWTALSERARKYGTERLHDAGAVQQNYSLFVDAQSTRKPSVNGKPPEVKPGKS